MLFEQNLKPGSRILFASVPVDGHFNPLHSLAIHFKNKGHDVRWYNSQGYQFKVELAGIPFYPFKKALEMSQDNIDEVFPERKNHKGQIAKLKFDLKHGFILRSTEYYEDIKAIHETFPFDVMIADCAYTAIPFVKEKLDKPVIAIGVLPLMSTSRDLPPAGLGLTPSYSSLGRVKQHIMRWFTNALIFKESKTLTDQLFDEYGIEKVKGNVFDVIEKKSTLLLQSGTPGFDYKRSDLAGNVRFIGPLLPYRKQKIGLYPLNKKPGQKVILVTQGTVEKDIEKLIVPVLQAFKGNPGYLVVVTTGGSQTDVLRNRFPESNIVIEDFIPFAEIMPQADVYISNGGYGGVMLSIMDGLPMITAGVHEGKNEICARVGYFNLGINLHTEKPRPNQILGSVSEILDNPLYKMNVMELAEEFKQYNPQLLCEQYLEEILNDRVESAVGLMVA